MNKHKEDLIRELDHEYMLGGHSEYVAVGPNEDADDDGAAEVDDPELELPDDEDDDEADDPTDNEPSDSSE